MLKISLLFYSLSIIIVEPGSILVVSPQIIIHKAPGSTPPFDHFPVFPLTKSFMVDGG